MPANLENSAVATGLEKINFHSNPIGNARECSNYCTVALISHASKVMLKILQVRLQTVRELWNSRCSSWIQEVGIPDPLTCLLKNLYASQEATVRIGHETTDWFQIGKGVRQGCILSPCLFNFYAEYIMRNAGLDEAQAGIKIDGKIWINVRYADDTTFRQKAKN